MNAVFASIILQGFFLLFRQGRREKAELRKCPRAAYKDIAGSQASASSSLAEAGDIAAVSAVHNDWHKW